jgi:hypothetical protein
MKWDAQLVRLALEQLCRAFLFLKRRVDLSKMYGCQCGRVPFGHVLCGIPPGVVIDFGSPSGLDPFVARYDLQYQNPFDLISSGSVTASRPR